MTELEDLRVIEFEAERLAEKLVSLRQGFRCLKDQPKLSDLSKRDLVLRECSPESARILHERFHYIGSYHEGIAHLGLFVVGHEDFPMALASLAAMDIHLLDPLFTSSEDKRRALVLSRVFAFDWAPRNTISYLLGRVSRWVKMNLPDVLTLFTF
jgi:hypothetical protein